MHSTKCSASPSKSSKALKNLHSFNFPFSLLDRYSAGSLDVLSTKCSLPSLHRVKPKRIFAPSTFLPLSSPFTVQGVWMCIPLCAALPLVEPYSTESLCLRPFLHSACPYHTTISEEHSLSVLFSLPRRVKTQTQAKFRKHSLSKRNTLM